MKRFQTSFVFSIDMEEQELLIVIVFHKGISYKDFDSLDTLLKGHKVTAGTL